MLTILVKFWCPCGEKVPGETVPRCWLCKRRHRPERKWIEEWQDLTYPELDGNPFYDPAYPIWVRDHHTWKYPIPYPRLGYIRPGEKNWFIRS
ncbi:hypothetical protein CMUS01_06804 [Colletotrichum musicola]|uniref:Uncharacterized protein n=1 Tax=Colletotrichum musicola TaxID=2175873 RepID=A0A8H6NH56_9PEZI|nr:hypothetical protein CMUS01_06804 [Colletotrichum musicola]